MVLLHLDVSCNNCENLLRALNLQVCDTKVSTAAFHRSSLSRLICQSDLFLAVAACLLTRVQRCLVSVWQKEETNLYAECAAIINPSWDAREQDMMIPGSTRSLLNALTEVTVSTAANVSILHSIFHFFRNLKRCYMLMTGAGSWWSSSFTLVYLLQMHRYIGQ